MRQLEIKLEKTLKLLEESEERYIEMHQKCLDERREKEEQIANMQDFLDTEISRYRDETDLYKERVRAA
jgi:hypothetical protein